jgi:DNA-binding response OmpR family regulator
MSGEGTLQPTLGRSVTAATAANALVLVVDDDAAIRVLVSRRLEHVGYKTLAVDSGEQALEIIRDRPVDLVVLDVMMPGLDGYQVLEQVRARHAMSSLPVIMLTARDKGDDVIKALRLGANDYATKPVDFPLLLKRMDVHLALKRGENNLVGHFRIGARLGSGGMGVVYKALDTRTNQSVAIKILPRSLTIDESFVQRFLREASLAQRIDHPNVVRVLDAGRCDETYYIAMELVDGGNLGQLIEAQPMSPPRALDIARQMAAALKALKDVGVLHRDVKPENVIVSETGIAKLTDFGIARDAVAPHRMTDTGVGVGSVLYASPEQIKGTGDYRSDIYSLGCTLFFMLTGTDPFPGDKPVEWVLDRKTDRVPKVTDVVSEIPKVVAQLVAKLMDPDADKRFQTYDEISASLTEVLLQSPTVRQRPRRPWLVALAAAVGLAAAAWLWHRLTYG